MAHLNLSVEVAVGALTAVLTMAGAEAPLGLLREDRKDPPDVPVEVVDALTGAFPKVLVGVALLFTVVTLF
jgi:hypothetical protein